MTPEIIDGLEGGSDSGAPLFVRSGERDIELAQSERRVAPLERPAGIRSRIHEIGAAAQDEGHHQRRAERIMIVMDE